MTLPESYAGSNALQFVQSQGWNFRTATEPNIEVENCPYCKHGGHHLRMSIHGASDPFKNKDGLHTCMRCGKSGNLFALKQALGIVVAGMESRKEYAAGEKKTEELPNLQTAHDALLEDADVMDYLMNIRGFSRSIIEKQKIGLVPKRFFRECGKVKALVYPYLVNGNSIFVHYRTLPPSPKAFSSPAGWPVPLYNGEVLNNADLTEVIFVEGEPDCIAALDHGVTNICGVPGANFKKAEWIDSLDRLERIYICYDKDKVGQKAAQDLANRIGVEKCWKIYLPDFQVTTESGTVRPGKDLNEYFTQGGFTVEDFNKLKDEAQLFDVAGVASSKDAVQEFLDELEGKEGLEPKYKTQWPTLNTLVGFDEGDVIDILAPEKVGKAQPLTAKLKTPDGWMLMGDVRIGDKLASTDGKESTVTGIFPQGKEKVYRVTFADGRSTTASGGHLWSVQFAHSGGNNAGGESRKGDKVLTTEALRFFCLNTFGRNRHNVVYIPRISGEFGEDNFSSINPWLLGIMLGDGCMSGTATPVFTSIDKEIVERVTSIAKLHKHKVVPTGKNSISYRISFEEGRGVQFVNGERRLNPFTTALKELGLWGTDCFTKFIPKVMFSQSRATRISLLQGLMDSDGTVSDNRTAKKNGCLSYTTVSEQLAKDVQELVWSVGGMATISGPFKKSYTHNGEKKRGAYTYRVNIRVSNGKELFLLSRKRELVREERSHECRLTVTAVEAIGEVETQCIMVSHPSHLYITDDYVVTHNTTFAMNIMEHMVDTYGEDGVFICLEMTRARMARKWIAYKAQIADNIPRNPEEAKALKAAFTYAIPKVQEQAANREGDFYFCYPKYKTVDDIYNLIRDCIRRYGAKWICIDNIQRLCDTTLGSKQRTQHLSEISKVISQIAKDYNVQIIRVLQPHRIAAGKIATTDNVDGASQIGKDCDCMMVAHRDKLGGDTTSEDIKNQGGFVYEEQSFSDDMIMTVGLSRYSGGGRTTLHYNGATSTVSEKNEGQIAKMKALSNKNVGYEAIGASLKLALNPEKAPEPQPTAEEDIKL